MELTYVMGFENCAGIHTKWKWNKSTCCCYLTNPKAQGERFITELL